MAIRGFRSRGALKIIELRGAFCLILSLGIPPATLGQSVPRQVPPRRSTQLAEGFGMNVDLPRDPRLPWTRRWWTRIFDSGVKWVRIGQYENSSEKTSWDWVEQTPGNYAASPDVDEAIRSLVENGVDIEIELQYSNPLYQWEPEKRPRRVILPPPGIGPDDEPPNPIFIPPKTEEQIEAFLKYVRFMVKRYKRAVKHWELWNEPNIAYWRPKTQTKEQLVAKARDYGKVLGRFADAVHETDPEARVLTGGTAGVDFLFVQTALAECASKVDIVAYHTYPGFGRNHMPEEADTLQRAAVFRDEIRRIPGIWHDVSFWNNEWNVSPSWPGSNESVQARYLPRFYLYNLAQGVKGFIWVFVPSTDGNEDDLYGILHGETFGPDAFQPRAAYRAFEVTTALFGQTMVDPIAEFGIRSVPEQYNHGALQSYAFRDPSSRARIYAFWLAVVSDPGDHFAPVQVELDVKDPEIRHPVLIDARDGSVTSLAWKSQGVLQVPLKDSVMAVADASYLNWPELPEVPGELRAIREGPEIKLGWKSYGGATPVEMQRSIDDGPWQTVSHTAPGVNRFSEPLHARGHISYRLRALGKNGPSPWSNPAWIDSAQ